MRNFAPSYFYHLRFYHKDVHNPRKVRMRIKGINDKKVAKIAKKLKIKYEFWTYVRMEKLLLHDKRKDYRRVSDAGTVVRKNKWWVRYL